jgi:hypothetical protein
VIAGRNSFLPIISGRVVAAEGGAQLRMTLRLHTAVAAFEAVIVGGLVDGMVRHGFEWGPVAMIAAIVGMTIGFFFQETHRALAILRRELDKG